MKQYTYFEYDVEGGICGFWTEKHKTDAQAVSTLQKALEDAADYIAFIKVRQVRKDGTPVKVVGSITRQ